MNTLRVAVDGPAGAGKSSLSKLAASQLGFLYIDTGAMYRAAALFAINNGIDPKTRPEELVSRLDGINIKLIPSEAGNRVILNGEDVTDDIRSEEVSVGASNVAVIPEVREKLVELQRAMADGANVIMDGRDIGTHVLPDAELKIFLTADPHERAVRRYKELSEKGVLCDLEKIEADIIYRDKNDSERAVSPLRMADDAVLYDTTDIDFDGALAGLEKMITEKMRG